MFKREQRGPWLVAGVFAFMAIIMAGTGVALAVTTADQASVDCPVTSVGNVGADGSFSVTLQCRLTLPVAPTPTPTPTATPTPTPVPTTPSPTPTPTSTPPATNCMASPHVCGLPDATNTGVPPGTVLTPVNGDLHVKTAGSLVDARDITGCLFIEAPNVTVKRTRINCPVNWAIRNNQPGLVVQDSELICGPNGYTGINGQFTALRVNIHGCENGFQPDDGTLVQDSYVHDLNTCCNNHPDGAEFGQGSGNITFRHNTIIAPITNSAIIMWDEGDPQNHDVAIVNNLLAGGGFTLYCPRNNASGIVVADNRFGPSNFGPVSSCIPGHVTIWSNNVFDTTGAPVKQA